MKPIFLKYKYVFTYMCKQYENNEKSALHIEIYSLIDNE